MIPMKQNEQIDKIITILKHELKDVDLPIVSRKQWDQIPHTPFTVLISCILSLRTKDEITEQASIRLLKDYNTPQKLLDITQKEIQDLIYPVGFYKTKAQRIQEISSILIEKYNAEVPKDFNSILELKGVGRKTANIVMVYGFHDENFLPIDTHCHRIPNRIGWISTKNPEETEYQLRKILPKKFWLDFNHLFVIFGQTICVPISPHCTTCPIQQYCKKIHVKRYR